MRVWIITGISICPPQRRKKIAYFWPSLSQLVRPKSVGLIHRALDWKGLDSPYSSCYVICPLRSISGKIHRMIYRVLWVLLLPLYWFTPQQWVGSLRKNVGIVSAFRSVQIHLSPTVHCPILSDDSPGKVPCFI